MTPLPIHHDRAKELMTLALGVGISSDKSREMIAAKLAAWDAETALLIRRIHVAAGDSNGLYPTDELVNVIEQQAVDAWKYGDLKS